MLSERRQFARALRQRMTRAEEVLWAHLRGSRFHGTKFRRAKVLEGKGVRVLRFTNAEVCDDLDSVLVRIQVELRLPFD